MTTDKETKNSLKDKVLKQIESEAICPKSRFIFTSQEIAVWFFWFLTIVFGSLAVAASSFVFQHQFYAIYEITHGSFWLFFLENLPILWIVVFTSMVLFAVYNLRHTKKGYRYPLWQILGSSLILSLVGGSLLHLVGVGFVVDKHLGVMTRYYESQDKREQRIWQQPEQGRLLGHFDNTSDINSNTLSFIDANNTVWATDISELNKEEIELLFTGVEVRLFGKVVQISPPQFHVCATLPANNHMLSFEQKRQIKRKLLEKSNYYRVSLKEGVPPVSGFCGEGFKQLPVFIP